ncbi:MAG: DUF669 domain-containing protein [Phycisphaeraceae bacterium]|nr:DUF669 domain-containing protein [Phycisphaeraceae bacterium]MCW5775498.1 DUF669 domain-containing protein [Phycisphaeraceae bacterium]
MASLNNFDANQVDPSVALDPLPAGKYIAVVSESELKPTKAGGGKYLQLTFQIIEGEHKGRLAWARLNLENKSEMTVKIARGELSAICRAVGVMQPRDSVELHNVPLEINVGLKKRDDNGEFTNVIKGYAKKGGTVALTAPRPAAGAGPGSTPPWKR